MPAESFNADIIEVPPKLLDQIEAAAAAEEDSQHVVIEIVQDQATPEEQSVVSGTLLSATPRSLNKYGWQLPERDLPALGAASQFRDPQYLAQLEANQKEITRHFIEILDLFYTYTNNLLGNLNTQPTCNSTSSPLKRTQSAVVLSTKEAADGQPNGEYKIPFYLSSAKNDPHFLKLLELSSIKATANTAQQTSYTLLPLPPKRPPPPRASYKLSPQKRKRELRLPTPTVTTTPPPTRHQHICKACMIRVAKYTRNASSRMCCLLGENLTYTLFVIFCLWCLYMLFSQSYKYLSKKLTQSELGREVTPKTDRRWSK